MAQVEEEVFINPQTTVLKLLRESFGEYEMRWMEERVSEMCRKDSTRPTFSQFWSFKIHCTTFLKYFQFTNLLILGLHNCKRVGRETGIKVRKQSWSWLAGLISNVPGKCLHKKMKPKMRQKKSLQRNERFLNGLDIVFGSIA